MDELENVVEEITVNADETVEEVVEETIQEESGIEEIELTDGTTTEADEEVVEEEPKQPYKVFETEEEYQKYTDTLISKTKKKYNSLISVLKSAGGFETDDPNELEQSIRKSYEDQGLEVPKYSEGLTPEEQRALAKVDADGIISLGDLAMKETFSELYNKKDRTVRENELMFLIGSAHSKNLARKDLIELGANPDEVLEDSKFKQFAKRYSDKVSIKEIYQDYKKINGTNKPKSVSAGSVKSTHNEAKQGENDDVRRWREEAGL